MTCGDYTLKQGEDYTLSFDTDNTEIGTVLMRINGTGGFTNYRQTTFHIASDISQAEVIGLGDSYPFTGSAYTPDDLGITEVRIGETVLTTDSYSFAFDEKLMRNERRNTDPSSDRSGKLRRNQEMYHRDYAEGHHR